MKKPIKNLFTGKTDTHTAKMDNRRHDLTMNELVETNKVNDGGNYHEKYSLALIQPLSITPYKSQERVLHTKNSLLPILLADGISESEIPVRMAS